MSKKYILTIRTEDIDIPTILQALAGSATLVSIVEDQVPAVLTAKKSHYANGKRDKGISGVDLALDVLRRTPTVTTQMFEQAFVERGFAAHSHSSAVHQLVQDGRAIKLGTGMWTLAPAKPQPLPASQAKAVLR